MTAGLALWPNTLRTRGYWPQVGGQLYPFALYVVHTCLVHLTVCVCLQPPINAHIADPLVRVLSSGVVLELAALSSNAKWISERTTQLNANITELVELNDMTERLLAAINALVTSTSEEGGCSGSADAPNRCSSYWSKFYPAVLDGYNFTDASSLTSTQLQYVLDRAMEALQDAAPYSERKYTSDTGSDKSPLYGKGTASQRSMRGGINGKYTRRFFMNTQVNFAKNPTGLNGNEPPVPASSPFKQILAVGNGGCMEHSRDLLLQ